MTNELIPANQIVRMPGVRMGRRAAFGRMGIAMAGAMMAPVMILRGQNARPDIRNNFGLYRVAAVSGIITGVAAGTNTAGHLFSMEWVGGSNPFDALIKRIRVRWQTLTPFTAGQEILMRLFRNTWSAVHSGGTQITAAPKKYSSHPASKILTPSDMRIATTGALTAGTSTLETESFGSLGGWTPAGPAVAPEISTLLEPEEDAGYLQRLTHGEGFVVRNEIAMGAAGTGRLSVEVDWIEMLR